MAKDGNLFIQYFKNSVFSSVSPNQLYYFEDVDFMGAFNLLATYLIDNSVGSTFWDEFVFFFSYFLFCINKFILPVLIPWKEMY